LKRLASHNRDKGKKLGGGEGSYSRSCLHGNKKNKKSDLRQFDHRGTDVKGRPFSLKAEYLLETKRMDDFSQERAGKKAV